MIKLINMNGLARVSGGLLIIMLGLSSGCAPTDPPPESGVASPAPTSALTETPAPGESVPTTRVEPATAPDPAAPADLWSRLQQPETRYFVLMRHAIAPGTGDPDNFQLDDCATQRNLSAAGQAQAQRTGAAFRDREVPVDRVLSSEWCRCLETAALLDLGDVERFPVLNSFFRDRSTADAQTQDLREFMETAPDQPGVTVLVTHFVNIAAIAGDGVSSGAMVVMQVNDADQVEVVGRITEF